MLSRVVLTEWSVSLDPECVPPGLPTGPLRAAVPATLLSALAPSLPDPNLSRNNLHPLFAALERCPCVFHTDLPPLDPALPQVLLIESLQLPAQVILNSHTLLASSNAFHPHALLLPPPLLAPRRNRLSIHFPSVRHALAVRAHLHRYREWNDPVGGVSSLRLPQYLAGWDWAPRQLSPAIPRPISLLRIPRAALCDVACIQHIHLQPSLRARLHVVVHLVSDSKPQSSSALHVRCALIPHHVHRALSRQYPTLHSAYNRLLLRDHSVLHSVPQHHHHLVQIVHLQLSDHDHQHPVHHYRMCSLLSDLSLPRMSSYRCHAHVQVNHPQLWWPNGMGQQHLYHLHVAICASTTTPSAQQPPHPVLHHRTITIGLRQLHLIRDPTPQHTYLQSPSDSHAPPPDPASEQPPDTESFQSFTFCVNGRSFFAKGANYIPSLMQYHQTTPDHYEQTIQAACHANMNMLRVWGGGVYEHDAFYDLCNRHGILLWHDFMFACALYPGDQQFLDSCRTEARHQVCRLRNHPCMALWCGNNELEQVPHHIVDTQATKEAYHTLFYDILPAVVDSDPGQIPYWPSSPHNPFGYERGFNNPRAGDTHFWDVWHARKPLSSYLKHNTRFCSEFGMQSYLSEAGARAFAGYEPGALNPFGPVMEAHQKNANGNLIILEYCQRLFRAPKDYSALSYQSQLNQMICMQTGVEHFRRSWPYCAGALYWQLNDCWPCFSWSSIEFGGNWKALHHAAKRFFAPLLVSALHRGEESIGIGNLLSFSSDTGLFSIFATFDGEEEQISASLSWSLVNIHTGESVLAGTDSVVLKQDTSCEIASVDARESDGIERNPRHHVLRVSLGGGNNLYQSTTTAWLCSPRYCDLPQPQLTLTVDGFEAKTGSCQAVLRLESTCFAPFVEIFLKPIRPELCEAEESEPATYTPPTRYLLADNFFDLFAGEAKLVQLTVFDDLTENDFASRVACRTLVDTYMT